jgi:hypothetical protein
MAQRFFSNFVEVPGAEDARRSVSPARLKAALEASWAPDTAYLHASRPGNPALGQCYPTSRVVQWFFPRFEIASGEVDTGTALERHFWNIDPKSTPPLQVDLTWQQFEPGSIVSGFAVLDRHALNDSPPTVARCERLLERVLVHLANNAPAD